MARSEITTRTAALSPGFTKDTTGLLAAVASLATLGRAGGIGRRIPTGLVLAAALAVSGCGERPPRGLACPPDQTSASGPEAIDAQVEATLRDAIAGMPVPPPAERTAARRAIVAACLRRASADAPRSGGLDAATDAIAGRCQAVIDRYLEAETAEAVLAGEAPDPGGRAAMRATFRAEAAALVRERRAGRCPS